MANFDSVSTTAPSIYSFPLNPGLNEVFPWIAGIAD